MGGGVQQIADRLADRLGRPVLVEDPLQRVVAYSEQHGPIDEIRQASILRRHTTPIVRDWLRTLGVFTAQRPLRTPGAPHLGFLPRVCVPARCQDHLLGFLWFIDPDASMTDDDIAVAAEAADLVALALFHESLVAELSAQRERDAVTNLLTGPPDGRVESAALLVEADSFPRPAPVTVFAVLPLGAPEPALLEHGLLHLRRRLGGRAPLHLIRSGHGALLTSGGIRAADLLAAFSMPVVVGGGCPRPHLSQAAESYAEALQAAEIASRVPQFAPAAEWPELGVYRLLARLAPSANDAHPGLETLLAADRELARTLETYLDLAGHAQDVAAHLRLHRSTLYHRLRRIEQLTGADLANGEDRLALHVGLKLAHLRRPE